MKRKLLLLSLFLIGLAHREAQAQVKFPVETAQFAKRASEATDISLDKNMLQLAAKFLSTSEEDQQARRIIANLDGIYVRSYFFGAAGSYSAAEIDPLRKQVESVEWARMISTRSKGPDGDTDVYIHSEGGQVKGLFAVCAGPAELTFIYILGPIKPENLTDLSGNFGIPIVHDGTHGVKRGSSR
jgi:hypothetical protein